jgi:cyanophycin synthetase
VVVESYIEGFDHRLLVINGELVAAAKRIPGHVVGDGRHTVAELVDIVNQDPRRGIGHEKVLTRIELDAQAERLLARGATTSAPCRRMAKSCTCAPPPTCRPAARPST